MSVVLYSFILYCESLPPSKKGIIAYHRIKVSITFSYCPVELQITEENKASTYRKGERKNKICSENNKE